MLLIGTCSKCRTEIRIDVGDEKDPAKARSKAASTLQGWRGWECPGKHVELSPPVPHYWDVESWALSEGSALTEEEWVARLREGGRQIFTSDELRERYTVNGFGGGMCAATRKSDGASVVLDYDHSPGGTRYYWEM